MTKSKTIRISTELYEFVRKQMDPLNDTMDTVLKRLLPNPDAQIKYAVNDVIFTDLKSATRMSVQAKTPIHTIQFLS